MLIKHYLRVQCYYRQISFALENVTTPHKSLPRKLLPVHYSDVIVSVMASQITSLTIVYSAVYSGTNEIKHPSSSSMAFVRGIHRWPLNSPHKGPVTRKMFPFDYVIMDLWLLDGTRPSSTEASLGLCSLRGRTFYRKTSRSLEATIN